MLFVHSLALLAANFCYLATSTPVHSYNNTATSSSASKGFSGLSRGPSSSSNPPLLSPPYLNDLAQTHNKLWFGTAANIPNSNGEDVNAQYMSILNSTKLFGQLTPAAAMKFETTQPASGTFNFTAGDAFVSLASANHQYIRCHNLIWSEALPSWVNTTSWDNATLTAVMQSHITSLIGHWGNACYSWDVVNEALNYDGTFVSNIWYDNIGPEYFFLAYRFATEAVAATGHDIKLYYNDWGIESPSPKTTAAAALISELQARGIQIDGVGLESHFEVGGTPSQSEQITAMEIFTALGVDVVRTEIDIRFLDGDLPYNVTGLAVQKQNYYDTVASCMAVEKCIGMTVWDFDDKYSWVSEAFEGEGGADLYGPTFGRKPAYYGVAEAIVGANCSNCLASYQQGHRLGWN